MAAICCFVGTPLRAGLTDIGLCSGEGGTRSDLLRAWYVIRKHQCLMFVTVGALEMELGLRNERDRSD